MSRSRIGWSIVIVAAIALAGAEPATARIRIGGALGFIFSRLLPRPGLIARHHVPREARHASVRDAAQAERHVDASSSGRLADKPSERAQIVATAALAGLRGSHGADGWWRHSDGGYGWVGPLFWPFAYFDITDYAVRDDATGFWDYGYPDLYAALFAPYGSDELKAYLAPPAPGRQRLSGVPLTEMCGTDKSETASLPTDRIKDAIQPTEAQRSAFDDLAKASVKAADTVRKSCPMQMALMAKGRLAAMEQRIAAMADAVEQIRPPLETLYGMLDDAQKARFNALADEARKAPDSKASLARRCGAASPTAPDWPAAEIESSLHPQESQRVVLKALQDAGTRASDMLQAACQGDDSDDDAATPVARILAVERRLDGMLQAVELVRSALDDVYDTLSDEQKAQFETIGPKRAAS